MSKPLVLETVFIAVMFNTIYIYCKVSRTSVSSCILRVLQKTDFGIYKLFLVFVVKFILVAISEPRLQRSVKEIKNDKHIKGPTEGFSDVCKYKFSQMNSIKIHKSVCLAVLNRHICRQITLTSTTVYLSLYLLMSFCTEPVTFLHVSVLFRSYLMQIRSYSKN